MTMLAKLVELLMCKESSADRHQNSVCLVSRFTEIGHMRILCCNAFMVTLQPVIILCRVASRKRVIDNFATFSTSQVFSSEIYWNDMIFRGFL